MSNQSLPANGPDDGKTALYLGLMFVLCGAAFYVPIDWAEQQRLSEASSQWPTVEGRIYYSTVEAGYRSSFTRTAKYRYTVNGTDYEGYRISWRPSSVPGYEYERARHHSPHVNIPCRVYYHPHSPAVACLKPKVEVHVNGWNYAFLAGIAGVATWLGYISTRRLIWSGLHQLIADLDHGQPEGRSGTR